MMAHKFDPHNRLSGVHPDLVAVVRRAAEMGAEFIVAEGCRTIEKQRRMVATGASKTMNSRHIPKGDPPLAHAVDLVPMLDKEVRWDWPLVNRMAGIVKAAARELDIPIEWGGDWKTFKDGPHFQLPWGQYP